MNQLKAGLRRQEVGLLLVIVVLTLVFGAFNSHFLSSQNGAFVLQSVAVIGIMAVGQVFVLISGEIDLSVGSVLGLTGAMGAWLMAHGVNPWLAVLLTLVFGAVIGLIQGFIIVYGKVSSFIVTLGMLSVARGLTEIVTNGLPISLSADVLVIGQGTIGGLLTWSAVIFIIVAILGQFVLSRSVFGSRVTAIGDNIEAARLGGIPVRRTRALVFVISGTMAAVAGIVYATQSGYAEGNAGTGDELFVIAAVVIGGASLSGGRGSVIGALLGAVLLGALQNAFVLLHLSPFLQQFSIGVVIVLAALFDQVRQGAFTPPRWLVGFRGRTSRPDRSRPPLAAVAAPGGPDDQIPSGVDALTHER
jgi:ribose/xylose/arabinose/galactoside ABC-type transport system permease subunit